MSKLEFRTPQENPPPTLSTLSHEDASRVLSLQPILPGGSDQLLLDSGIRTGLFASLRDLALFSPAQASAPTNSAEDWSKIKLRYIWCEKSVWEMPWGVKNLQQDIENARKSGRTTREVEIVQLPAANHFVSFFLAFFPRLLFASFHCHEKENYMPLHILSTVLFSI